MRNFTRWLALLPLCTAGWAQEQVHPIFLEPVDKIDANRSEIAEKMPLFRRAASTERHSEWMHNESAERAFRLYRAAVEVAQPGAGVPDYYIALVPGGNHAAVGFRLQTEAGVREYPKQPYILLDAQPSRFETTLLHETGHMAMALVAGGRLLDGEPMAAIPHSTSSLSDRTTAFTEGYAIHLETLAAHLNRSPNSRQRFHHENVMFGDVRVLQALEYFRHSMDLTSYSQNVARYTEVRENNYSFESAFQGTDYLRVQLEKARDYATVRDANQLLQSEGFYASFFFLFTMRGSAVPAEAVIAERERRILEAMKTMFTASGSDASSPWVLKLTQAYMGRFPEEKTDVVDALNDLSHGVFVDPAAASMWREHYLAALRLDFRKLNAEGIAAARKKWRERVIENPQVLYERLGPEIRCTVAAVKVRLEAFGRDLDLAFDINTVQPGVLRLIPGISEAEISTWMGQRAQKPFASAEDLRARAGLRAAIVSGLRF